MLPNVEHIITSKRIPTFFWNIRRKTGASFCQVIKIVLIKFLEFFRIFKNHSCRGALAIFMASAMVGRIPQIPFVNRQEDRTRIPDEID